MAALTDNYEGLSVWIYDMDGNNISSAVVKTHDKIAGQITVASMPRALKTNDECRLLILTTPVPCEFHGKVKKESGKFYIAMFQGREKENRIATRFDITIPATIDTLICDNWLYPLYTPVSVTLMNISTGGVRFRAPHFSLSIGDKFELNMIIRNEKKRLAAEVMNHVDKGAEYSDYGCRFIG